MAEYDLECCECGWRGLESALDKPTNESGEETPIFCPNCGGSDFKKVTEKEEKENS